MEAITIGQNWSKLREQLTMGATPTDISKIQPLPLRLRKHLGKGNRKILRAKRLGYLLVDCVFYIRQGIYTYEI